MSNRRQEEGPYFFVSTVQPVGRVRGPALRKQFAELGGKCRLPRTGKGKGAVGSLLPAGGIAGEQLDQAHGFGEVLGLKDALLGAQPVRRSADADRGRAASQRQEELRPVAAAAGKRNVKDLPQAVAAPARSSSAPKKRFTCWECNRAET